MRKVFWILIVPNAPLKGFILKFFKSRDRFPLTDIDDSFFNSITVLAKRLFTPLMVIQK